MLCCCGRNLSLVWDSLKWINSQLQWVSFLYQYILLTVYEHFDLDYIKEGIQLFELWYANSLKLLYLISEYLFSAKWNTNFAVAFWTDNMLLLYCQNEILWIFFLIQHDLDWCKVQIVKTWSLHSVREPRAAVEPQHWGGRGERGNGRLFTFSGKDTKGRVFTLYIACWSLIIECVILVVLPTCLVSGQDLSLFSL